MNHKQERLDILKMIQDGIITAEEGAKLLAFFPTGEEPAAPKEPKEKEAPKKSAEPTEPEQESDIPPKKRGMGINLGKTLGKLERGLEDGVNKLESGIEGFSAKVENWAHELEQDIAEGLGERNGKVVMISGLGDVLGLFKQHRNSLRLESQSIDGPIKNLSLLGRNATVSLRSHDEPTVVISCEYTSKKEDTDIKLIEKDGKLRLDYDESQIKHMSIRCKVPASSIIEDLEIENRNGPIDIEDVTCDNVHLDTSNATIRCDNLSAQYAKLDTSNATVKVSDCTIRKLDLDTSNAKIELDIANIAFEQQIVHASTSNGMITFAGPRDLPEGTGMWVNADTTNATVTNNLPYLNQTVGRNKRNDELSVQSAGYEEAGKKLKVNLDTSNASVRIGR